MQKITALFALALGLAACGPAPENDPIYQALKANPPTEIPAKHLPKLRRGAFACDIYNEGQANQYMTCWWPADRSDPPVAVLTYYGPSLSSPRPEQITVPGGEPVTDFLLVK
ncbi:MAG: hypothetical protein ACRBBV_15425 [Paracoccaceae bacterium]